MWRCICALFHRDVGLAKPDPFCVVRNYGGRRITQGYTGGRLFYATELKLIR
jgi:hypothetical protein